MPELTVEELAGFCAGRAEGEVTRRITGVASPDSATIRDLVFADSERSAKAAIESLAGCVLLGEAPSAPGRTVIRVANPKLAFAKLAVRLHPPDKPPAGIHPKAAVDEGARLGRDVHVGAFSVVGAGAVIG